MVIVRRNPLQAAVGALLAVGLLVSGIMAVTGRIQRAAVFCENFGYQPGYGYGYAYDPVYRYGCALPPTTPTTVTTTTTLHSHSESIRRVPGRFRS